MELVHVLSDGRRFDSLKYFFDHESSPAFGPLSKAQQKLDLLKADHLLLRLLGLLHPALPDLAHAGHWNLGQEHCHHVLR